MKAILKFGIGADLANVELDRWSQEHRGYYGKPHGVRRLNSGMYCGYSTASNELVAKHVKDVFSLDVLSFERFGAWLSCGGNFTAIGTNGDQITVLLDGVRHGLRFPFGEFKANSTWEYLETQMPDDCHPYETRDEYAYQSLENALRCKEQYVGDLYAYEKILTDHRAEADAFASEWFVVDYYDNSLDVDWVNHEYVEEIFHEMKAHLYVRGWLPKYIKLAKQSVMRFGGDLDEANSEALFLSLLARHPELRGKFEDIELNEDAS